MVTGVFELSNRRLYLCTPLRQDLAEFVEAVIRGGVDIVQLREKDGSAEAIREGARVLLPICHEANVPFILNDDAQLALDVGADGVHVGQDDESVSRCRALLGSDAIVGLSTHADDEFDQGLLEDVTYLSAGPIEETPTKPGRRGTGLDYVARAQARSDRPVFVTGGVTASSIPLLANAGVEHFVVVRALTQARNPYQAARELRAAIDLALG
jgi:thiamine-phosphate pyrophosphorylase